MPPLLPVTAADALSFSASHIRITLLFEDREEQVRKKLGEIRGRMQGE